MRRRVLNLIAAVGLALVAGAIAAGPAVAHGAPYTVTAGSAPTGTSAAVTLTTTGTSPRFLWKDTATGVTLTCDSVSVKGNLTTGSSSGQLGTLAASSAVFTNCVGPVGIKFTFTGYGTWTVNAIDSTSGSTSIVVTNVRAHAVAAAGPTCAFDFAAPAGSFTSSSTATTGPGALVTRYDNSTHRLSLAPTSPGSLGMWNVNPAGSAHYCWAKSIWSQGDLASWSASWQLTADNAAYNPIAIT